MPPYTNYAKDTFFAPRLSEFKGASVPSLGVTTAQAKAWLPSFVTRSIFLAAIPEPERQLMFNLIRRADSAILEYERGSTLTLEYFAEAPRSIAMYSRCLHAFEATVAATFQGFLLLRQLHPGKPSLFERNDGTELQRLDRIYNASKHADEYIANGGRFSPGSTLTVWLINDGLECQAGSLSFRELADGVELLARAAMQLSDTAPSTVPASASPAS